MAECDKLIGQRIKRLREKAEMSQLELAVILGVSREKISKIESGAREAKAQDLLLIAEQFNVTTDYLLRGVDTGNIGICETLGLSNEAINTLRAWKDCKTVSEGIDEEGRIVSIINTDGSECLEALESLITIQSGQSFLHELQLYLLAESGETYTLNQEGPKKAFTFLKATNGGKFLFINKQMIENVLFDMLKEPLRQMREAIRGGANK